MSTSSPPHETCMVFNQLRGLDRVAVHRFVVGEDPNLGFS
jgi:hypothetical protein